LQYAIYKTIYTRVRACVRVHIYHYYSTIIIIIVSLFIDMYIVNA